MKTQANITVVYASENWYEILLPVKHPLGDLALKLSTGFILFKLHGENWLLFFLSPDVALANIMKFPSSPPGVHISGSCCNMPLIKNYEGITTCHSNLDIVRVTNSVYAQTKVGETKLRQKGKLTYRRPKIMSNFMSQGDVGHGRRYVFSIVEQCNNAGVERLHAAPVMLEIRHI